MGIEKKQIRKWIEKNGIGKFVVIVICGMVLLLFSLPQQGEESTGKAEKKYSTGVEESGIALDAMECYAKDMERKTSELLEKAEGVGAVKVMVTLTGSQEKITLQDDDTSQEQTKEGDSTGGERSVSKEQAKKETVLVQRDGEEEPYVVQLHSPEIEGVVVVAQGAESIEVKREIIEAIQALFPIEAHKIKVMKMK